MDLIAAIHTIQVLFTETYIFWRGFINTQYYIYIDTFYIYLVILLPLSWRVFNNECIISYFWKKTKDKDYKQGSTTNTPDLLIFSEPLVGPSTVFFFGMICLSVIVLFTIYKINIVYAVLYTVFLVVYLYLIRTNIDPLGLLFSLYKLIYMVVLVIIISAVSVGLFAKK